MPRSIPPIEAIHHVHFVAVCGTAMGSLACMLAERGFRVTGSDTDAYPPMSDQLRRAGIEVQKGWSPERVRGDEAEVQVPGGHWVRLKQEAGIWRVRDFD